MAFTVRRPTPLTPAQAWTALTDFAAHTAHVPLTTVTTDPGEPYLGWGVVAFTGIGPVGFNDSMQVTGWEPPHRFRVVKTGRVLQGWAEVSIEPDGSGSIVTWTEEIALRAGVLTRLTRQVGDLVAPALFGPVVDGLLQDAEAAPA